MPPVKPIPVDFGKDQNEALRLYVERNIKKLKNGLTELHTSKVQKWRRIYKGLPLEEERSFPWRGASNLVIQVIGENVDLLTAFILGSIYEIAPLYTTGLVGEWKPEDQAAEQQDAIHSFMNLVGLDPQYLDLYRIESAAIPEGIKYGTVAIKFPWLTDMESEVIGDAGGKVEFTEFTKYDGPRPEKIEFDRWAATPSSPTLEDAAFKYHEVILTKQQMEERFFKGVFSKGKNDEIKTQVLNSPDNPNGPDEKTQQKNQEAHVSENQGEDDPTWTVHECWFPYFKDGHKFRLIYTYHLRTQKTLRAIFNFYPKNEEPWEIGRLGYAEDGLYGYGYCEMLEHYQAEVSSAHNQRGDNKTLANTSVIRVDPDALIDAQFSVNPMAILPFREGQMEIFNLGSANAGAYEVDSELHTLMLAKQRAGTEDPGQTGNGGASVSKRGGLSAMGTFSVMQSGNRRRNLKVTDMRYLHLKMGRKLLKQYSEFGIGDTGKFFGNQEKFLKMALASVKNGRLYLPIRAATASINKELEKQNDMLLTQVMQRHHMGISQILQSVANPVLPPEIKKFLVGWIDSSSIIMQRILRNFGYDDTSRLLPEQEILKGAANGGANNASNPGANNGGAQPNPQGVPAVQGSPSQEGNNQAVVGLGGGNSVPEVPTGN